MTKKQQIFHAVGMAFIMSLCMSLVMALKMNGMHPELLRIWIPDAITSFCVALPLSFFVPALLTRIMDELKIK